MRYPKFRKQRLFVGSGVIEAGCKTLIATRLKRSECSGPFAGQCGHRRRCCVTARIDDMGAAADASARPKDYDVVNALQKQYKLTPLSSWGKPYTPPADVPPATGVDVKTPPTTQVQRMDANAFFGRLARLMKDNPPAAADAAMVEKLRKLGIEPGKDFDISKLDAGTGRGLQRAMGTFSILDKAITKLKTVNGWIVIPKDFADYGTDYTTRAGIALVGLGGIRPPDVVYPTAFEDGDGKPFDGAHRYLLHFEKGQTPPTNATWSLAIYDPQGFYVPNSIQPLRSFRVDASAIQFRWLARSIYSGKFTGDGYGV